MRMRRFALLPFFTLLLCPLLGAENRTIRIEYPNGGEILKSGATVVLQWRSLGVDGPVAILLFQNGEQRAVIAASAPNSGSFAWAIPAALPDGGQYRLRICWLRDLRVNDFSDRDFAIN